MRSITDYIYNSDCLEGMKSLPDASVGMVLTDLPYGRTDCEWDIPLDHTALWEQLLRVARENAAFVFCADMKHAVQLINTQPKLFRYDLVWHKTAPVGFALAKRMPMRDHELVLVFYRRLPIYHPQGVVKLDNPIRKPGKLKARGVYHGGLGKSYTVTQTGYPRSVMTFAHDAGRIHPTQKPVALFEYLVRTYTDESDLVLDPCMGSGTTAVACVRSGRHYIGYETSEDYIQAARKRAEEAGEPKKGNTGDV